MAQNNTQKVIRNLLRLAKEKNYFISFVGSQHKRHIPYTNDYEMVREKYKTYSNGMIEIAITDPTNCTYSNYPFSSYFEYSINDDKIRNYPTISKKRTEFGESLLKEAQFLTDIGL